ncbi:MAG: hypothetical protein EXX96DRAFT_543987 [Benjaminiella poitrasii]|nr:MAG: hypothetical protein EXX96DRAFT_543987 [Benjaminiella poitrasii]
MGFLTCEKVGFSSFESLYTEGRDKTFENIIPSNSYEIEFVCKRKKRDEVETLSPMDIAAKVELTNENTIMFILGLMVAVTIDTGLGKQARVSIMTFAATTEQQKEDKHTLSNGKCIYPSKKGIHKVTKRLLSDSIKYGYNRRFI